MIIDVLLIANFPSYLCINFAL